jgi:t-SNARE complex subunit (syntaxin)
METKTCPKCKETKQTSLFSRNKNKPDGYQRECKVCMRTSNMNSYNKNKKAYHARSQAHTQKVLNEISEYKVSQTCKKCGCKKHYLLEFHHIDPSTKDNDVSTIIKTRGRKIIWDEIAKCVVLCKNCHADSHYQERENGINLETYLS